MHPLLNIAISAARKAGDFIGKASQRLDLINVTDKDKNNFVTQVDKEAEQIIISTIHQAYPDHAILAEESGVIDGSECRWIIDPLDGTTNFIHGFPHYAVSIAVEIKQRLEIAAIYNPVSNELFTAVRGNGAQLNNQRLRVSAQQQLSSGLIATGIPYTYTEHADLCNRILIKILETCNDIRRAGAASLDLAYVAAGRLDGYWEMGLAPWDMAAGILLVKEAGGLVSDFTGGEDSLNTGEIVAGNPKLLKTLLQVIRPLISSPSL